MLPVLVWVVLFLLVGLLVYRCLVACGVELPLPGKRAAHFQSEEEQAPSCRAAATWKVFLAALGFRLGLLAVGLFAAMVLTSGESTFQDCFQRLCQRWDGYHYVQLVEKGYTGYRENGQHLFLVFFPGFVWATRLLRLVIPNTLLAGVTLSTLCAAGGSCYVYQLAAQCYNPRVAKDALLFLSLFPFSFFSGTMMTEGLFLLTTAGACYYALRGRWFLFGLLGVGAALTRMTGVLVVLVGAMELLEREKTLKAPVGKSLRRCWKGLLVRLPFVLMPLLGTGCYLLLNQVVDGDPFAFVTHQEHWYQGFQWMPHVVEYVFRNFVGNMGNSFGWSTWFPALALFGAFLALLFWAACKKCHRASLLVYGGAYFVATYSLSWLLSAGRYLSCCFVLFLFLAKLTEKRPAFRDGILGGEAVLLGITLCGYLNGAQIM